MRCVSVNLFTSTDNYLYSQTYRWRKCDHLKHGALDDEISKWTCNITSQCGLALTKWKFVQVVYVGEYGSQFVPNMFGAFYHAYILGNGSIGNSGIRFNWCKCIFEFFIILGMVGYLTHDTIKVLHIYVYGSHWVRDTFGYHVYIVGNG